MLEEIRQKILENNKKVQELVETNRSLEIEFSKSLFIGKKVKCFPYGNSEKVFGKVKGFYLSEDDFKIYVTIEYSDCDGDLTTTKFNVLEITDY
jgi:hypothetical protein